MSAAPKLDVINIGPQPGPQTSFLTTAADIAIYGGAAGGGKSYALLLEPLRHHDNKEFGAVIFRRNSTQVRNEGALWDESAKLYGVIGARPREAQLEWIFSSGAKVKFAHLEHDRSVLDWQGSQIPLIGFDELTHFSERQFWYMLSRNRSTSGVPPYIRATCNPDVDSWVRTFIDWWIGEDGFAIPERSGVLRWFARVDDTIHWADSPEELKMLFGEEALPKSATFIPSKLTDNPILMAKDPGYLANLRAMTRVDRERLEKGNWNIRVTAGSMFQRHWFGAPLNAIPNGWTGAVRFWDRAASKVTPERPDPDWTRGLLVYRYPNKTYLVADMRSLRDTPGQVESLITTTAAYDTPVVRIMAQQDPGSAGVAEKENFVRMLQGFDVHTIPLTKDKLTRAKPVSAQCEVGNIRVLRAPWNEAFFNEIENFPEGKHDDIVDTLSGAFNELSGNGSWAAAL